MLQPRPLPDSSSMDRMDAEPSESADALQDERALVRSLIAGDRQAFEAFADSYVPALHRFASSRLRGPAELIREVVQSTLANAIPKLPSFRGEATLMTWLCACCRNEIALHYRRRNREPPVEPLAGDETDGGEGPEGALLRDETSRMVHMALDLLPPHHSRALEWKYLEQLSVQEIAERMQLGTKAAESLLTRARASFRERFRCLQGGRRETRD